MTPWSKGVLIAATPIEPPQGDRCWAFHVVNGSSEPIESVALDLVSYEWGDLENNQEVGARFGPVAPGASIEIWRETDTELRTLLHVTLRDASGERGAWVEFPRLYHAGPGTRLVPIQILGRKGLVGEVQAATSS